MLGPDVMFLLLDRTVLLMGPFMLCGGAFLVCLVGYTFFSTPFVSLERGNALPTVVAANVLGLWLWFNVLFNWFLCWRTNPGNPPPGVSLKDAARDDEATCQKCERIKPARAHHCHVCQRCVLAMDHHCPWMANCIGHYNLRYFILTLFYLTVGCFYCVAVGVYQYNIFFKVFSGLEPRVEEEPPRLVTFVLILCTCVGSAVFLLFAWNIYLVITGQTTIEFYQRRATRGASRRFKKSLLQTLLFYPALESNDYDLGSAENWARVFGENSLPVRWILPSTRPPPGDGLRWKSCKSLVSLV